MRYHGFLIGNGHIEPCNAERVRAADCRAEFVRIFDFKGQIRDIFPANCRERILNQRGQAVPDRMREQSENFGLCVNHFSAPFFLR